MEKRSRARFVVVAVVTVLLMAALLLVSTKCSFCRLFLGGPS